MLPAMLSTDIMVSITVKIFDAQCMIDIVLLLASASAVVVVVLILVVALDLLHHGIEGSGRNRLSLRLDILRARQKVYGNQL